MFYFGSAQKSDWYLMLFSFRICLRCKAYGGVYTTTDCLIAHACLLFLSSFSFIDMGIYVRLPNRHHQKLYNNNKENNRGKMFVRSYAFLFSDCCHWKDATNREKKEYSNNRRNLEVVKSKRQYNKNFSCIFGCDQ